MRRLLHLCQVLTTVRLHIFVGRSTLKQIPYFQKGDVFKYERVQENSASEFSTIREGCVAK